MSVLSVYITNPAVAISLRDDIARRLIEEGHATPVEPLKPTLADLTKLFQLCNGESVERVHMELLVDGPGPFKGHLKNEVVSMPAEVAALAVKLRIGRLTDLPTGRRRAR